MRAAEQLLPARNLSLVRAATLALPVAGTVAPFVGSGAFRSAKADGPRPAEELCSARVVEQEVHAHSQTHRHTRTDSIYQAGVLTLHWGGTVVPAAALETDENRFVTVNCSSVCDRTLAKPLSTHCIETRELKRLSVPAGGRNRYFGPFGL